MIDLKQCSLCGPGWVQCQWCGRGHEYRGDEYRGERHDHPNIGDVVKCRSAGCSAHVVYLGTHEDATTQGWKDRCGWVWRAVTLPRPVVDALRHEADALRSAAKGPVKPPTGKRRAPYYTVRQRACTPARASAPLEVSIDKANWLHFKAADNAKRWIGYVCQRLAGVRPEDYVVVKHVAKREAGAK